MKANSKHFPVFHLIATLSLPGIDGACWLLVRGHWLEEKAVL